jgi:hypothetical protein
MSAYRRAAILATVLISVGSGNFNLCAQANDGQSLVLHIQRSATTSQTGFPTYFYVYNVLDGAKSTAEAEALSGTISLQNYSANFSEVLWLLAYWEGACPGNATLTGANFIWSDILKNPSQSAVDFPVNLTFPSPLPLTGCIGFIFGGGPLVDGQVTMSADLNLTYQPSSANPNTVFDLSGEYCFGQNWGCQNATTDDKQGFAVPIIMPAGQLVELFGNISDSTFDGTQNFGPLPTGKMWGAINDFYLLPDGCGKFGENLNQYGFPNPVLLATLYSWLPQNALHLKSVPLEYQIPPGKTSIATLQQPVERFFPIPVTVNAGSCMVVIYGRTGNGATDNETQVKAVLTP